MPGSGGGLEGLPGPWFARTICSGKWMANPVRETDRVGRRLVCAGLAGAGVPVMKGVGQRDILSLV